MKAQGDLFADAVVDYDGNVKRVVEVSFNELLRQPTIGERFEAFHRLNPHVLDLVVNLGLQLKRQGFQRASVKMIIERLRWETFFRTKGEEVYKINNSFTAYYARMAIAACPALDGFFSRRQLRGGWEPPADLVEDAQRRNPGWGHG